MCVRTQSSDTRWNSNSMKSEFVQALVKKLYSYLLLAKLSATRSSNISKSKWVAKLISIALYWMYSSAFNRFWGLRHQTKDPTMAPATEISKLEKSKYFSKIWYYTVWKIQDFSVSKILCEINFEGSRSLMLLLPFLGPWKFGLW